MSRAVIHITVGVAVHQWAPDRERLTLGSCDRQPGAVSRWSRVDHASLSQLALQCKRVHQGTL